MPETAELHVLKVELENQLSRKRTLLEHAIEDHIRWLNELKDNLSTFNQTFKKGVHYSQNNIASLIEEHNTLRDVYRNVVNLIED